MMPMIEESFMAEKPKGVFGLVVGNRNCFPDGFVREGRKEILRVLNQEGYEGICLSEEDAKCGAVETHADAVKCAELFCCNAKRIEGIIVTLPNFGDEQGIADTIRISDLKVPILMHATPDVAQKMGWGHRRDAFCGKMSACNNLFQYGIPFTLTALHTVAAESDAFRGDLNSFAAICRIVRGLKNVRLGAVGARPAAFKTVRYSEKLLERNGISVETLDLSDVLGRIGRLKDEDTEVKSKLEAISGYVPTTDVPPLALLKMAKLGAVLDAWVKSSGLNGIAVQCWTSLEENFGVVPCTIISMMTESMCPAACEVDVTGLLAMYTLQLASSTPSAIVDWNNNYGGDPEKAVIFHCSNLPKSLFQNIRIDTHEIFAGTVGKENTYGTINGNLLAGPLTYLRLTTDDFNGEIKGYLGEGEVTVDPLSTFGGAGVVHVKNLQRVLQFACKNGFEHHVAVNHSRVARPVLEALSTYLGWNIWCPTETTSTFVELSPSSEDVRQRRTSLRKGIV
jgi:L-fucose isomerase-like protein